AAGVASDSQGVEPTRAGVSPSTGCTTKLAWTGARSARRRHQNGPYHVSRSVRIGDEAVLARAQGGGTPEEDGPKSQIPAESLRHGVPSELGPLRQSRTR